MRFIELDELSKRRLETMRKIDNRYRVRDRAHALILSSQGLKINEIAAVFGVDRDTISEWYDRWETKGFEGLSDAPGAGRPSKLNSEEKKS